MRKTSPLTRTQKLQSQKERQLVIRITVLSLFTVGLILAIAIWGVQAFIDVSNVWLDVRDIQSTPNPSVNTSLPTPSLNQLTDTVTNQDHISIHLNAPANSNVILERNGVQVGQNTVDNSASVLFPDVTLQEGRNQFKGYVIGSDNHRSSPSNIIEILRDTQPPTITVEKPFSGETYKGQSQRLVDVVGTTSGAQTVFVQDTRVILNPDGSFTQKVKLDPGENTISIYALDAANNPSVTLTRVIRWEE